MPFHYSAEHSCGSSWLLCGVSNRYPNISDHLDQGGAIWLGLDLAPKCIDTPIAELNDQLASVEMRPFDPEVAAVVEAAGPPGAIYPTTPIIHLRSNHEQLRPAEARKGQTTRPL